MSPAINQKFVMLLLRTLSLIFDTKRKEEEKKRKRRKKEEEVVSENTQWDDPFFRVEISIRARVRYVCRGGERFTSSNECFVRARKKKK